MEKGAPMFTGGMIEAETMCDALESMLKVDKPRSNYPHGWGDKFSDAKLIRCYWNLSVMDFNKHPVTLSFDIVDNNSPVIFRIDIRRISETCKQNIPNTMTFKRPSDKFEHNQYTYMSADCGGNTRLRLDIATHKETTIKSLMESASGRLELTLAKFVHIFGH